MSKVTATVKVFFPAEVVCSSSGLHRSRVQQKRSRRDRKLSQRDRATPEASDAGQPPTSRSWRWARCLCSNLTYLLEVKSSSNGHLDKTAVLKSSKLLSHELKIWLPLFVRLQIRSHSVNRDKSDSKPIHLDPSSERHWVCLQPCAVVHYLR